MSDFTDALARLPQYNDAPYNASTNPYGMDNQGYLINIPQMTDDIAIVCGGVADAAEIVGEMSDDIEALGAISAQISTLAAQIPLLTSVAGLSGAITTLAGISSAISTVATNAVAVSNVSGNISNINAVNAALSNVNAVAAGLSNIASVLSNMATITGVHGKLSDISAVSAGLTTIAAVVANMDDVNAVAVHTGAITSVAGKLGDISVVAASSDSVGTVASNIASVNAVVASEATISNVAANLTEISTVSAASSSVQAVATNITNVNTVAGANAAVASVAGIAGNVTTVAGVASQLASVASNAGAISAVGDSITSVDVVANNIAAIQGSSANANTASNAAQAAQTAAASAKRVALFMEFDSGIGDTNPGSGCWRINNGALGAATQLFISTTAKSGGNIADWLDTWDDSSNPGNRGEITFIDAANAGNWLKVFVTGANTVASGYYKIAISYVDHAGSLVDAAEFSVEFSRAGDVGAAGSGSGTVQTSGTVLDNRIAVFSGTTGNFIADGGKAVSDLATAAQGVKADTALQPAAVGVSIQGYDATLAALAAITTSANKLIYATGSDTFSTTDLTAFARSLLDDADAAAARSTLGVVIGTNVQAYNGNLSAIAGLTSAADRLPYFTGSGTATLATFTSFARGLLDDANASAARTTLGLGTAATSATGDFAAASHVGAGGTAHANAVASGAAGFMTGADKAKLDGVATGATANATNSQLRDRSTHTGTQAATTITGLATVATSGAYSDLSDTPSLGTAASAATGDFAPAAHVGAGGTAHAAATTSVAGFMSSGDKTKLDGVASGATANATDAQLRNRSTHTGTQAASTITGLATVATSGAYGDLSGRPALGTAAAANVGDFATSAQGAKADSAAQLNTAQTWTAAQKFGRVAGAVATTSGTALNNANGNEHTRTVAANTTFTVSNVPASGDAFHMRLLLTYTSGTITWFSGVNWVGGTAPTFTGGKKYEIVFSTENGGTTWRAAAGEYAA
jgi:hypothetical protein